MYKISKSHVYICLNECYDINDACFYSNETYSNAHILMNHFNELLYCEKHFTYSYVKSTAHIKMTRYAIC